MSDSLWPHGLLSPWNSPGQNTEVDSLSLLQGIFPSQGSNPGLPHCRQILYQLSRWQPTRVPSPWDSPGQDHWNGLPFPSPMHECEKWKWSRSVVSTLRNPMDCSLPGSPVHGIFQARVLEWGAIAFSAAAAKSLQSCPTLCDPIDGSPPGSAIPGILQARTLEWVAIAFSVTWSNIRLSYLISLSQYMLFVFFVVPFTMCSCLVCLLSVSSHCN